MRVFEEIKERLVVAAETVKRPEYYPLARVHTWLTYAALWIVAAECVISLVSTEASAVLFVNIYCIVVLAALSVSICCLPVLLVVAVKLSKLKIRRILLQLVSGLLFALPNIYVLQDVLPEMGAVVVVIMVAVATSATFGVFSSRAVELDASWLLAALIGGGLPLSILASTYYTARIDPHEFDVYFAFAFGIAMTAPLIAVAIFDIFRAALGFRISLAKAVASLVSGTVVCYVILKLIPEFSGDFESFVIVLSTIAIVLGMTRLGPSLKTRYTLPVYAIAIGIQLFLLSSQDSSMKYRWTLSTNTIIAGELLKKTPVGNIIYGEALVPVKNITDNDLVSQAREWNANAEMNLEYRDYSAILITVDTMRYRSTGYSGQAPDGVTPNLDRLAARSIRFHSTYSQGGWTSLAVPALLWSKYPARIGFAPLFEVKENLNLYFENEIPKGAKVWQVYQAPIEEASQNIAEVLKHKGYKTMAVINDGATQYFEKRFGFSRGFEDIEYPSSAEARKQAKQGKQPKKIPIDNVVADRAIEKIRAIGEEKFFLWVHFYAPHGGIAPGKYSKGFDKYHSLIHYSDAQVGRILEALNRSGKSSKTLVIVSADHGHNIDEHRSASHGSTLYDETMKIPLVVHLPEGPQADIREQSGLIDIAPTILDYLGIEIPGEMQGFTLRRIVEKTNSRHHPPIVLETWRREVGKNAMRLHLLGIVDGDYKLIFDKKARAFSLFHLKNDPAEKHNLLIGEMTQTEKDLYNNLRNKLVNWPEPTG